MWSSDHHSQHASKINSFSSLSFNIQKKYYSNISPNRNGFDTWIIMFLWFGYFYPNYLQWSVNFYLIRFHMLQKLSIVITTTTATYASAQSQVINLTCAECEVSVIRCRSTKIDYSPMLAALLLLVFAYNAKLYFCSIRDISKDKRAVWLTQKRMHEFYRYIHHLKVKYMG